MFNILVDFQDRFQTLFLEGSQQESGCCSDTWVAGGTLSTEREEQESDILTSQKLSFRETSSVRCSSGYSSVTLRARWFMVSWE